MMKWRGDQGPIWHESMNVWFLNVICVSLGDLESNQDSRLMLEYFHVSMSHASGTDMNEVTDMNEETNRIGIPKPFDITLFKKA